MPDFADAPSPKTRQAAALSGETATTFSAMADRASDGRRSHGSGSMFLARGQFWGGRLRAEKTRRARTLLPCSATAVFGGDRNVVGQTVMEPKPYRVIGVMRSDFGLAAR